MTRFEYIFVKSYADSLEILTNFIDNSNSWDIYANMEFVNNKVPNDLFEHIGLDALDAQIKNQLFDDIKFMSKFSNSKIRASEFKKYYCSSRLFDYYNDLHSRKMCQIAFNAIAESDGWEYLKNNKPNSNEGFMFTSNEKINEIIKKVSVVDDTHSGSSMAFTMRSLEYIAQTGFV